MNLLHVLFFVTVVFGGSLQLDLKKKSRLLNKRDDGEVGLTPKFYEGGFVIDLMFGSNKEKLEVLVDTGSSDLWVPSANVNCSLNGTSDSATCPKHGYYWEKSTTFNKSSDLFAIIYGDNTSSIGFFGQDTVWIGDIAVKDTIFGVANQTDSSSVMGIGLPQSEAGHSYFNESVYPNFPQKLKDDGIIDRILYSILLDEGSSKSSLLFGAVDHAKYSGELLTLSILRDDELESTMSVELDSLQMENGDTNLTLVSLKTGVEFDTGSSYSWFSESLLEELSEQLGGEAVNGTYFVNSTMASEAYFYFTFQNMTIMVPVQFQVTEDGQYILPYFILEEDTPPAIILGQDFLTQIYAVFDLESLEISIAPQSGSSKSNIQVVGADGKFNKSSNENTAKSGTSSIRTSIYMLVFSLLVIIGLN